MVRGFRLVLLHIPQDSFEENFENLAPGPYAVLSLQLVDQRDLAARKLERDGFRRGFLVGQAISLAAGRLSTLKLAKPLLLAAYGVGVAR